MKKIFALGLSVIMFCFAMVGLTACGETQTTPSLDDREIGYQIPVYPQCSFDYSLEQDNEHYLFHIESITATLIEKNSINSDDIITGVFYRYAFQVTVKGTTASELAGRSVSVGLYRDNLTDSIKTTVQQSGSIECSQVWYSMSEQVISFADIYLYD